MRGKVLVTLVVVSMLALTLSACGATPAPVVSTVVVEQTVPVKETVIVKETSVVKETAVVEQIVEVVVTPTPGPHPEAVIEGVEPNAEITFWTFWLSPNFDEYIANTIARFQEAYPGVQVKWEDHQATFQDDLRNSFAAGIAPDVINLSVGEGWVSEYATKDLLLNLDEAVPQSVKDLYFPGLWEQQLVDGNNYQFPWYQGIAVELINRQIYDETGLAVEDFPKTVDGLPELCRTIKEKTGTLCDIRLTVNDLLSQMVYEGDVKVISDDGTTFTFDSPEGVAWLQMYVDMVEDGTIDKTVLTAEQDRTGLDLFVSGKAAFYQTGPNLIREVRSNNPGLYGYLAVVQAPVGKSGIGRRPWARRGAAARAAWASRSRRTPSFPTLPLPWRSSLPTRAACSSSPRSSPSIHPRRLPTTIPSSPRYPLPSRTAPGPSPAT